MLHPGRTIRLHVLGRPRVADGESPLAFKAPQRAFSLLAYLLVHRGRAVGRDAAAFALWPDDTEADARANLRRHLFALVNDALPAANGVPWVLADKRTLRWNPDAPAWSDVAAFEALAGAPDGAEAAVELYAGDLLEGFEDEWIASHRERLRELQIALLLELIGRARAAGDPALGIDYARRLLAIDPWREDGVRALIALRAASGDRAGALAAYRDFAKRLDDELGVAPMAETTAEFDRVSREDPAVAGVQPRPAVALANAAALRPTVAFTGRDAELAALDAALWEGAGVAAIVGLGGIGKTALAREYARRRRDRYAGTWLLDAESESGIVEGFVRLGVMLAPQLDAASDRHAVAEHVATALLGALPKPLLLIFDNLNDDELLRAWLPHGPVHAIVTSRHAAWSGDVAQIRLAPWPLVETVQYLRTATGRTDLDDDALREIAATLGSLPLANAHAAAYLRASHNVTARRYLERLHDHLSQAPRGAEYDRAVVATFREAIARAEGEAPGAAAALALAAFVAPDGIPEELFHAPAAGFADRDRADDALAALHRLSLLAFAPETRTYAVHRLVQTAARRLCGAEAPVMARAAVEAVDGVFPAVDFRAWPECERLLPHARAALGALDTAAAFPAAVQLAQRAGAYLAKRAAFGDAEQLLRRSVALAEASAEPAGVAAAVTALAGLLRDTNRAAEAEPLLRRAVERAEAAFGADHPRVAAALNDLAILLQYANRLEEAEMQFRRALAVDEAAHGADDVRVALRRHNLALALHEVDRPAEAEPLLRRALAIDEARRGADHPDVATDLLSLAWLLFTGERRDEAEPLLRRAAALRAAAFGEEHPSYALALDDLAVLLHASGRSSEAEPLAERALAACEAAFGPAHPVVAALLNTAAELQAARGERDRAEHAYRLALAIDEASFGPAHPATARDLNNLAVLLAANGRSVEAQPLLERALAVTEAAYGPNHSRVAIVRGNRDGDFGRTIRRSPSRGLRV